MTWRARVSSPGWAASSGTRVAQLIEQRPWADEVMGVDFVPPRRRLRRAEFRRIDPRDRDRLADVRAGVRADGRRALRRVRARVAHDAGVGVRTHRAVHDRGAERGGARRPARVRRVAQRARGVRTADGPSASVPDEDVVPGAAQRLRPLAAQGRERGEGHRAADRACRCARCGTRRSSARTCRARSGGCCACRSCR